MWLVVLALLVVIALMSLGCVWLLDRNEALRHQPVRVIGRDVSVPRAIAVPAATRKRWSVWP